MESYLSEQITTAEGVAAFFLNDDASPRPVEQWWYSSSSLGIGPNEAVPPRPYIVWNEGEELVHQVVRETSKSKNRSFRIFVYDYKGDFTRINLILDAIQDVIRGIAPVKLSDGTVISEGLWMGKSARFVDDGYDSCTRYGEAVFTVSK